MQKEVEGGVAICCDFCGAEWDQVQPMIEGHHGSVLCLECLKTARRAVQDHGPTFACTMCLRELLPENLPRWKPAKPPAGANPQAVICGDCLEQAEEAFDRDPDVHWSKAD